MKLISYLILLLSSPFLLVAENAEESQITVKNISTWQGNLVVAIFNSEKSYLKNPYKELIVPVAKADNSNEITIKVSLQKGIYAVVIYHDINADGELDTNLFGVPSEPTGFSNNVEASFGPPDFEKVKIDIPNSNISIELVD